jgi:chaperonin GroES
MPSSNGKATEELLDSLKRTEEWFPTAAIQSNIIIKPCEAEGVSEGGIIIPDSVKERPSKGKVISMGEDLDNKPVKVGMIVHHVKGAGVEMEYQKEAYFIMRYSDCLCYDKL